MSPLHRPFRRVGVVNRGEAAVRFLRAARTWSARRGVPLEVVALYTHPDRDAVFVREADAAVCIGDALERGADGATRSPYLDVQAMVRALVDAGCDAAWPGWGFLSENPSFADACAAAGVVFIGPGGEAMRLLGDKIAAKKLAQAHGVPVLGWSGGPVTDAADAAVHAQRLGYPVLLKAAAGGGGRGIREVPQPGAFDTAFTSARAEAMAAFGDGALLVERLMPDARHVEVQVLGDAHGHVHAIGTRDCSMQRRHQKILEEAPAPGLSAALEQTLLDSSVRLARAVGYVGAGTVEFLVSADGSECAFLEMNTRLQVEHPVTECVTGLDLVGAQLDIASGEPLSLVGPASRGHAIEARLCAEDPDDQFTPSAGRLMRFDLPHGPGIRIDSGFLEGAVIPGEFDSMLAKVIATGDTREEALARLDDALARFTVAIEGGASNRSLLLELVRHPRFRQGPVTTRWLDGYLDTRPPAHQKRLLDAALVAAAVSEYVRARRGDVLNFFKDAQRGLPHSVQPSQARSVRFRVGDKEVTLDVAAVGPRLYTVTCEERSVEARFVYTGRTTGVLGYRGRRHHVVFVLTPTALHVEVDGAAHRLPLASNGRVVAPVPAAVTFVHVKAGDAVKPGDRLVTLEVMKMEIGVDAPVAGRVARLCVDAASRVAAGDTLAFIEPKATEPTKSRGVLSAFEDVPDAHPPGRLEDPARVLLTTVLGYDHAQQTIDDAIAALNALQQPPPVSQLLQVLEARVARELLFVRQGADDEVAPVDHLATYLRLPRSRGAGLPEAFLAQLRRALSFYEVADLTVDPTLESALLRLAQAHRNIEDRDKVVMSVLAALERHPSGLDGIDAVHARQLLETFAALTTDRNPRLAEAAWTALYLLRDRPILQEEARRLGLVASRALHDGLDDAGVLAPAPMGALLSLVEDACDAAATTRDRLLSLLVARLYPGAERLAQPKRANVHRTSDGQLVAAVLCPLDALLDTLARPTQAKALDEAQVVELFVPTPSEEAITQLEASGATELSTRVPEHVRRVSVQWGDVEHGRLGRTFVRRGARLVEDEFHRDFHPTRPEMNEVRRFSGFDLERITGFGETFLALVRAREDATDERFICLAEVERFDEERDASGRVIALPAFDRVFHEALHALREAQLRRGRTGRLHWNRLVVFVRTPMHLSRAELEAVAARLAAPTAGLGLERVVLRGELAGDDGSLRPVSIEWSNPTGSGLTLSVFDAKTRPVRVISAYERRVVAARRRGLFYPYELVRALAGDDSDGAFPQGNFQELDLDPTGERLVPVQRAFGGNAANVVVGLVVNHYPPFDDGLERVLVMGDPTRELGALSEPECRRIVAAFRLATERRLPVEWVPVSSGAKIAMDSGTENLDWTARVLAEIVRFTQAGGVVNVLVDGVCVGAQSYWNAEATMLMHCKGALVMTAQGSMLLTGKRALEFAGSVAAEDSLGIGGFERIMGPNGQAQYFAPDLVSAYQLLFRHYALTHQPPGERRPRLLATSDPVDRDPTQEDYTGPEDDGFHRISELFDEATNPGRKRPFAIRSLMRAVVDADIEPLERWSAWQGAQSAVVWEASLAGTPVCCIGIESRPVPRRGELRPDGPDQWTAGTLFPLSSKKVARALNVASGVRPVVVLANLSGFDGSPDSLRNLQLEYGAEIGRAVVNFKGPLLFCVVSRYHGGAYVVFSRALNEQMQAVALEGSYASVIGGAPAAAVVFTGLVRQRALSDPKVVAAKEALGKARRTQRASRAARYDQALREATVQAQASVAREFDAVHSVERAREVGSLEGILSPRELRSFLAERVRGR